MKKISFGASTACFYPMLLENTIICLGENNIKNIEVFFNTYQELKPDYVKKLKTLINNYDMNVVSVHPFTCAFEPFMMFTDYERRFLDSLEMQKPYFDAMNQLNANIFVFHGDRKMGFLSHEKYFERFAKLRDLGKTFGITVAQENVERCKSGSLDFLSQMINYLDKDVGLVFDNKQAYRSKISEEEFIDAVGENIIHMHISDHDENCDCIAVGKGTLDVKKVLEKLHQKDFCGSLIVELYSDKISDLGEIYQSYQNLINI